MHATMIQRNLLKKHFSQVNRSELREDITGVKKSIEKTWNGKCKSKNDLFLRCHRNKRLE